MKISAAGLALLKKSEGLRLFQYKDVAGIPTIGYGHRLLHPDSFANGIDQPQAASLLASDVRDAEQAVERMVRVRLSQGQFDALVDFVFNLGMGRLASSTLLKCLNQGRFDDAAEQLLLWDHAAGKECAALKARRAAELQLWKSSEARQLAAA